MTRQKEFDVDEALDRALEVFRERGYESASMRELLERMGIGRQSLYDTFGDKHELFLAALKRYEASSLKEEAVLERLQKEGALCFLRWFFSTFLDSLLGGDRAGCLIINTIQEFSGSDNAVQKVCAVSDKRVRKIQSMALEWGKEHGEFAPDLDVEVSGSFLSAQWYGLSVLAKQGEKRSALENAVEMTLTALRRG